MTDKDLDTKIDDLAGAIGRDVGRIDSTLEQLAPPNAESLHGQSLLISGTTRRSGRLADDPRAAYDDPAGASVSYIVADASFTATTPDQSNGVNYGDQGVLVAVVNGVEVDSLDLGAAFDETRRGTIQSYPSRRGAAGVLEVTAVVRHDFDLWQRVNARMHITGDLLVRGYNTIKMLHTGCAGGDQHSQSFELFWDDAGTRPSVTGAVLRPGTPVLKHLSGVAYYWRGSTLLVDATVNAVADNTYVDAPVSVTDVMGAGNVNIDVADAAVTGLSVPPKVGESMAVAGKAIALNHIDQASLDTVATLRARGPHGSGAAVQTPRAGIMVNTFDASSGNAVEHFDDERRRLPLDIDVDSLSTPIFDVWDSTAALGTADAMQGIDSGENALMYARQSFSAAQPAGPDYSGRTGPQQYLRCLTTSTSKPGIALTLEGLSAGLAPVGQGDVSVELRLPGQTGWIDVSTPYDSGAGVGADGAGGLAGAIRYSGGGAEINVTFGGKVTYDAGGRCYIRVTLNNSHRVITAIRTDWS